MRQFKTNTWCVEEVELILGVIFVLHHSNEGCGVVECMILTMIIKIWLSPLQLHRYFSDSGLPGIKSNFSSSGMNAKKYREKFH